MQANGAQKKVRICWVLPLNTTPPEPTLLTTSPSHSALSQSPSTSSLPSPVPFYLTCSSGLPSVSQRAWEGFALPAAAPSSLCGHKRLCGAFGAASASNTCSAGVTSKLDWAENSKTLHRTQQKYRSDSRIFRRVIKNTLILAKQTFHRQEFSSQIFRQVSAASVTDHPPPQKKESSAPYCPFCAFKTDVILDMGNTSLMFLGHSSLEDNFMPFQYLVTNIHA